MNSQALKKYVSRNIPTSIPSGISQFFSQKNFISTPLQKRNFSHTNFTWGGGHHHEEPDADDIKYGIVVPKPPRSDVIWAKILGASAVFWIWYLGTRQGVFAKVFGLERPHFEHPVGDELSDDDDEFFEANNPDWMKSDKDEMEKVLEFYQYRNIDPRPSFEEALARWKGKW